MVRAEGQNDDASRAERVRPGKLSALLQELVRGPEAASPWEEALRPGASIGRFELLRELGRGGFGVVWEARDRDLGRHVAFKAIRPGARRDVREERLLLEADAAARLSHPNIVTLYDVGRSEHGPYLVLELLQGKTLAERLGHGTVPIREAVRIGMELAKGLAHAHAHGVTHRDLKPENVFLCDDGQVKILDFGMAHAFGLRRADGGTPAYMAPEQLEGSPEDERTDVFALGVILFEMLSGRLPFTDERALHSRSPAALLEVPGEPALGELVARMLDKRPSGRPRDGGEVLSALSSFASELERAPGPAGQVRTRATPRFARGIAVGLAVVAVGVAGGTWWVRQRIDRDSRAATAAVTPSIAVLPFADLSPGKDQEYFSDGIAEEILTSLAQVGGLHVAGRTSSFAFKGKHEDLRSIGRQLNVSTILDGSVRKEGQRVRIAAEIVSVSDGYRLWSKTFDRELTGIFAIQDEIAQAIVSALEVKVLPGMEPSSKPFSTADSEAHGEYLLGRHLTTMGTVESTRRAVGVLEKAVAKDRLYAPAWARLGAALGSLALASRTDERARLRQRALEAAEKAVEVGPQLGEAYATRGWLRTVFDWQWTAARLDLERAIALSPGSATVRSGYSVLLQKLGRLQDAVDQAQRCLQLDPLDAVDWINLGTYEMDRGDFRRGRDAFGRALEISPESNGARYGLAVLDLVEGHGEDALRQFQNEPDEVSRLSGVAAAQHTLGH